LVSLLKSGDSRIRRDACYWLEALGPDAREAIPSLVDLLAVEKDGDVRNMARAALESIRQ